MRGFTHESGANKSVEWYTPPEIFDALGLVFDLDPCSPGEGKDFVPAEHRFTLADDGLSKPWFGTAFVNPPYGKHTPAWLAKLADHGDGVALVFARTDTRWCQEAMAGASAVCFIASRVRFYAGGRVERGGTPGCGSMLIAFGGTARQAVLGCGLGVTIDGGELGG